MFMTDARNKGFPMSRMRRAALPSLILAMAAALPSSRAALPADVSAAVAWYDTLGYPDVKDLPYVRVATGSRGQVGNQTRENRFVEGFLVSADKEAFTIFICSVADFKDQFEFLDEPYPALTTVRFVRTIAGPAYSRVDYGILDFKKVSSGVLERVRAQVSKRGPDGGLRWGRPVSHRVRIFAFARACLQKGLAETGAALMNLAANIPEEQTNKVDSAMLHDILQQQIGDTVIERAEVDFGSPSKTWADLLKPYDDFETRFPASKKIAYAREAAALLRKMITEEAAHLPKPLEQMSPEEQAAEYVYQLRNVGDEDWIMHSHYPDDLGTTPAGKQVFAPVDRLVDLGMQAVPQLIAALDDRRFTRCLRESFHGQDPPVDLRVGDIAQIILRHMSGGNFYPIKTDDGKLVRGTTRQQAEAWWAEVQKKGEKEVLVEKVSAGGEGGSEPARRLADKFPDAAINAIEAGAHATPDDGVRCEYIEAAASLPGETPLEFLKSELKQGRGLYSQVAAAKALSARGEPGAVAAMIEAWRALKLQLPPPKESDDDGDLYQHAGDIITFLAGSDSADAMEALAYNLKKTPVDVRLAVAEVFLPFPTADQSYGVGGIGPAVSVDADIDKLPAGKAGAAIERLLVSELDDTAKCVGTEGYYCEASFKDPRVCDMAALTLSRRWPKRYHFKWAANAAECDAQIAKLRDQWRSGNESSKKTR